MLGVSLGNLLVGLHVLHCIHRWVLLSALHERLIHVAGIFAHDLRKLVPLRLLRRGDAQLCVKLFDMGLDTLFGGATRRRLRR